MRNKLGCLHLRKLSGPGTELKEIKLSVREIKLSLERPKPLKFTGQSRGRAREKL